MKTKLHLRPLSTSDEIARVAAVEWHGLLTRRNNLAEPFGVALSGGRIARKFYEAVASCCSRDVFQNVHFFWADERCVPPTDAENNFRVARESLFEPLAIEAECIHRIRGEIDCVYAVREAEAEICRVMPLNEMGQPVLDLAILGMGEDGHIASLFPSEPPSMLEDARVYRHVLATKPPPERVTLGYLPLIVAREAWVLASGQGKADAIRKLKEGDEALPITRLIEKRASTTVLHEIGA